jgi:prephenate dehydrogenase
MRIALLGFGLIGGSIALALRERATSETTGERPRIVAWSPSGDGPAAAAREGVIDAAVGTPDAAVDAADLVVLAGPAPVCLEQLSQLAGAWHASIAPDAVITDVASSKGAIVRRAAELGLRFVGGHPMAGRDTAGYGAADPALFEGRPWVVVPGVADPAAIERVEALARAVGARPRRMDADEHDAAVAAISHLPLVLAAALVEAVAGSPDAPRRGWSEASAVTASGWRDMTRLARGEVVMGAGMITTNAGPIARRLRDLIAVLEGWLTDLDGPAGLDADAIDRRLRDARERLEADTR